MIPGSIFWAPVAKRNPLQIGMSLVRGMRRNPLACVPRWCFFSGGIEGRAPLAAEFQSGMLERVTALMPR